MATPSQLVNGPRTLQGDLQVLDNLHDLGCDNYQFLRKTAEKSYPLAYFGLSASKS